jgi:hypothetical protein
MSDRKSLPLVPARSGLMGKSEDRPGLEVEGGVEGFVEARG